MQHKTLWLAILGAILTSAGCSNDENARLAEMADRHSQQQAEQNQQIAELQHHMATERAEVGRQRDALEFERRELAQQRRTDSIIAAAITNAVPLLACLLPLLLCWQLLRRRDEPADDAVVTEVLIEDLVVAKPLLLPLQRDSLFEYRDQATEGGCDGA